MEYLEEEREIERIESRLAEDYENKKKAEGLVRCKECDEWVEEEDLRYGLCEQCVKNIVENAKIEEVIDYVKQLEVPGEDSEMVFYTEYLFTRDQIIEILEREAMSIKADFLFRKELTNYITNDTGDYLDYLESRGKL